MKTKPQYPSQPGVLTVSLPKTTASDILDELTAILHGALIAEGVGRFLWHQSARRHVELVFHILGERAMWIIRSELDRLGYDRTAFIVTDFSVQPIEISPSTLTSSTNSPVPPPDSIDKTFRGTPCATSPTLA